MADIESVQPGSTLVSAATELFRAYREFLQTIESTHCFDFNRFAQETADLPRWYTEHRGELLVATSDGEPAGCIAFREVAAGTCEIKRLFVLPAFRGQGLARKLVAEAIQRASLHGFKRVVLDTDIVSMQTAYLLYLTLGFTEYTAEGSHPPSLRFLERSLP